MRRYIPHTPYANWRTLWERASWRYIELAHNWRIRRTRINIPLRLWRPSAGRESGSVGMIDHDIGGSHPGVWAGTALKANRVGTAPPTECGQGLAHGHADARALQADRWPIVVGLLLEPAATSRDLIARLSAWPAEVRQHECADEPTPRGRGKRLESERNSRALSPPTSVIDEGISQTGTPAKVGLSRAP